jgi:hypothetical protein
MKTGIAENNRITDNKQKHTVTLLKAMLTKIGGVSMRKLCGTPSIIHELQQGTRSC